jgi:hypothetical protein
MALLRVSQSAPLMTIYMPVEGLHVPHIPHNSSSKSLVDVRASRWDRHRHASPTGSLIRQETGEGHATNESPDPHTPVDKRRGIACRLHENMRDSYGGQTRETEKAFTANINTTGSYTDDKLTSPTRATPILCHYCSAYRLHADGLPN